MFTITVFCFYRASALFAGESHFEEKDPLIQTAIVHAQFEIIHPFHDGNGRLGRLLMPLFLYHKRVLSSPMFYMSAYFERHRDEYYHNLRVVSQDENWMGWIEFFMKAVIEQSKINLNKAKAIMELYALKKERISEITHSQYTVRILDALFVKPIFTSKEFCKLTDIKEASCYRILRELKEHDVIMSDEKERNQTYFFAKLLEIVS